MCLSLHGTKNQCNLIHSRKKTVLYSGPITEIHENNTVFQVERRKIKWRTMPILTKNKQINKKDDKKTRLTVLVKNWITKEDTSNIHVIDIDLFKSVAYFQEKCIKTNWHLRGGYVCRKLWCIQVQKLEILEKKEESIQVQRGKIIKPCKSYKMNNQEQFICYKPGHWYIYVFFYRL